MNLGEDMVIEAPPQEVAEHAQVAAAAANPDEGQQGDQPKSRSQPTLLEIAQAQAAMLASGAKAGKRTAHDRLQVAGGCRLGLSTIREII